MNADAGKTTETQAEFDAYSDGLKMIRYIEDTESPAVTDNAKEYAKILGKIFTKFFNVQVPDVQYQSYA